MIDSYNAYKYHIGFVYSEYFILHLTPFTNFCSSIDIGAGTICFCYNLIRIVLL